MKNFSVNKILWMLIALMALVSSVTGVLAPEIYSKVMPMALIPATMAQDILTVLVSIALLGMIARSKEMNVKMQVVIMGIVGSMGYLYAIYSIERMYTVLYLVYLAILGLTLYSLPFSIGSIENHEKWKVPKLLKTITVTFSLVIATLFTFLWVGALIPVMKTGQKIELYYSIYILDLVWIMPGMVITAMMSIKNKSLGLLLTPAMYILGIFVIFPLGLGEMVKPFYGLNMDIKSMTMSFVLSGLFLLLATAQLWWLKKDGKGLIQKD